jgi:hypothetical protein
MKKNILVLQVFFLFCAFALCAGTAKTANASSVSDDGTYLYYNLDAGDSVSLSLFNPPSQDLHFSICGTSSTSRNYAFAVNENNLTGTIWTGNTLMSRTGSPIGENCLSTIYNGTSVFYVFNFQNINPYSVILKIVKADLGVGVQNDPQGFIMGVDHFWKLLSGEWSSWSKLKLTNSQSWSLMVGVIDGNIAPDLAIFQGDQTGKDHSFTKSGSDTYSASWSGANPYGFEYFQMGVNVGASATTSMYCKKPADGCAILINRVMWPSANVENEGGGASWFGSWTSSITDNIRNGINDAYDSTTGAFIKALSYVFIPSDGFFSTKITELGNEVNIKFPFFTSLVLTLQEKLQNPQEGNFPAFNVHLYGQDISVVNSSFISTYAPTFKLWMAGFLYILLAIFLIREGSILVNT